MVCKQTVVQVPSKGVKGVETGREEGCREAPGEDIYKSLGKIKFKAKKKSVQGRNTSLAHERTREKEGSL